MGRRQKQCENGRSHESLRVSSSQAWGIVSWNVPPNYPKLSSYIKLCIQCIPRKFRRTENALNSNSPFNEMPRPSRKTRRNHPSLNIEYCSESASDRSVPAKHTDIEGLQRVTHRADIWRSWGRDVPTQGSQRVHVPADWLKVKQWCNEATINKVTSGSTGIESTLWQWNRLAPTT